MKILTAFCSFKSRKLSSLLALFAFFALFAASTQTANATRIISISGNLNFGDVEVGSSAQQTFTISNIGSQNLVVQSIDYPPGFTGNFSGGPIHPGDSQLVTVTFSPTTVGGYGGTVVVNCNKTSGVNTIAISGNGVPSATTRVIAVSGDLNFGTVILGSSAQQTFYITNNGNSTLTVSNITYPTGFTGDFSSGTIATSAAQAVNVTFTPDTATSFGGTVTIASDATSGTNTFAVTGAGVDPSRIISLSADLNFGDVALGTSAQLTLTVTNSGNSTLTVSNVTYPTGFSGDFTAGTIAPGATTNITVTFSPTDAISYSGTITVVSDATSGTATANVSGNGVNAPARIISLSGDLNFGNVIVGTSGQQTFYITNTGNTVLTISNITYPTGFSGDFSSGTIATGAVQSVVVTFTPDTATSFGGTVTVDSDATSGINTFAVSGAGIDATRVISLSGDLNFGGVTVGTTAQLTLTITNSGNSALTVTNITYPTGFSGDFAGTIAPGATTNVTVTFSPTDTISYSGTVTVISDATSGVNTVTASGTGTPVPTPSISLSGDLNFGSVTVGSSAQLTLTITNTGTAALTVTNITYPTGFSGDFAGGTIAAGATTNVTVTFSPTDAVSYSGTITVESDAASGANTVNASGTGTAVVVNTRIISLSGDLIFGNVEVGSSAQLTLSITNSGNSALTVSNIVYPTGFSGDFSGTIAVGDSTNVTVTFSPVAAITYSGTVTVVSDATSGANTVNASGTGVITPLPYVARKARFAGLFYSSNNTAFESSGYFAASTSTKGKLKAKIQLAGNKYTLSGFLSPDGQLSGTAISKGVAPLNVTLEIHGDVMSGTISDGVWTSDLTANRNVFSKKLNAAPQAGTYTVTILGSGDSSIAPTTAGTGTVTITTGGIVKFVGTLGDGTKVSQSTTLSADGQWPFYVSLYSGNGSILGLPVISGNDVTGPVIWFKLAGANDPNYPAGFTFDTTLVGTKN